MRGKKSNTGGSVNEQLRKQRGKRRAEGGRKRAYQLLTVELDKIRVGVTGGDIMNAVG